MTKEPNEGHSTSLTSAEVQSIASANNSATSEFYKAYKNATDEKGDRFIFTKLSN